MNATSATTLIAPGQYESLTTIGEGPKFGIGTAKRPASGIPQTKYTALLGPGTYSASDPRFVSPKYSIGNREKDSNKKPKLAQIRLLANGSHEKMVIEVNDVPGPGTYTPKNVFRNTIGGIFSRDGTRSRNNSAHSSARKKS